MSDYIRITTEIVKVESKKLVSGDISYRATITTNDPTLLSLGLLNPNTLVDIIVLKEGQTFNYEENNGNSQKTARKASKKDTKDLQLPSF